MKKDDAHGPGSNSARDFSYLWRVYEGYELHADVVKPCGKVLRTYAPATRPELPEELSKLTRGDTDSTMEFIQEYGTLGYLELVASEYTQRREKGRWYGGDPLIWVWVHAETVRLCFDLTRLLKCADMPALRTYLRSMTDPYLDTIGLDEEYWPAATVANLAQVQTALWGNAAPPRVSSDGTSPVLTVGIDARVPESDAELIDVARIIRRKLINQNIARVYRHLLPQDDEHEQTYFGFTALVEVIYWHLADVVTSRQRIGTCEDCGAPFISRKATQRFCAHRDRHKESACAIRARVKKHRRHALAAQ